MSNEQENIAKYLAECAAVDEKKYLAERAAADLETRLQNIEQRLYYLEISRAYLKTP